MAEDCAQPAAIYSAAPSRLDQISTRWSTINEPCLLLVRYAPAIGKYFHALVKNRDDAAEVTQNFLLRAVKHGFPHANPCRGRFRDYLKKAVRNAARSYLERPRPVSSGDTPLEQLAGAEDPTSRLEREWLSEWQRCVLDRAWSCLQNRQRRVAGNMYYTVLRLAADHPEDSSQALAARAAALVGRPVTAQNFRTQLCRARRSFAELLALEVWQTLENPTPDRLKEELIEIGLWGYVHTFLPPQWGAPALRKRPV
jgi:hypothetical protein